MLNSFWFNFRCSYFSKPFDISHSWCTYMLGNKPVYRDYFYNSNLGWITHDQYNIWLDQTCLGLDFDHTDPTGSWAEQDTTF